MRGPDAAAFHPGDPFDTSIPAANVGGEFGPALSVTAGGSITITAPSGYTESVIVPDLRSGLTTEHGTNGVFLPEDIDALLGRAAASDDTSQVSDNLFDLQGAGLASI